MPRGRTGRGPSGAQGGQLANSNGSGNSGRVRISERVPARGVVGTNGRPVASTALAKCIDDIGLVVDAVIQEFVDIKDDAFAQAPLDALSRRVPLTPSGTPVIVPHRRLAYAVLSESVRRFCTAVDRALEQFDLELADPTDSADSENPDRWASFVNLAYDDPYSALGSRLASAAMLARVHAELTDNGSFYTAIVGTAMVRAEIAALSQESPPSCRRGGPSFTFFFALQALLTVPVHLLAVSAGQLGLPNTIQPPARWPVVVSLEGLRRSSGAVLNASSAVLVLVAGPNAYLLSGRPVVAHKLQLRKSHTPSSEAAEAAAATLQARRREIRRDFEVSLPSDDVDLVQPHQQETDAMHVDDDLYADDSGQDDEDDSQPDSQAAIDEEIIADDASAGDTPEARSTTTAMCAAFALGGPLATLVCLSHTNSYNLSDLRLWWAGQAAWRLRGAFNDAYADVLHAWHKNDRDSGVGLQDLLEYREESTPGFFEDTAVYSTTVVGGTRNGSTCKHPTVQPFLGSALVRPHSVPLPFDNANMGLSDMPSSANCALKVVLNLLKTEAEVFAKLRPDEVQQVLHVDTDSVLRLYRNKELATLALRAGSSVGGVVELITRPSFPVFAGTKDQSMVDYYGMRPSPFTSPALCARPQLHITNVLSAIFLLPPTHPLTALTNAPHALHASPAIAFPCTPHRSSAIPLAQPLPPSANHRPVR